MKFGGHCGNYLSIYIQKSFVNNKCITHQWMCFSHLKIWHTSRMLVCENRHLFHELVTLLKYKKMKVQGRVKKLMPEESGVSKIGNPWRSQEFIFEWFDDPSQTFSDMALLRVRNEDIDRCNLQEGEEVIVDIRHNLNDYKERLYNNVYARSIEKVKAVTDTQQTVQAETHVEATAEQKAAMAQLEKMGESDGGEDDMPF